MIITNDASVYVKGNTSNFSVFLHTCILRTCLSEISCVNHFIVCFLLQQCIMKQILSHILSAQ